MGDQVFGFRLLQELGRGAFARVFLARQGELADRPVVLKISAIEGTEPQTLAQLQHTHIVPIYSLHEDARAGLRAVCMPYFGGASLSSILENLWAHTKLPVHGKELTLALERVGSGERTAPPALPQGSYVQLVAWLMARLAEGLQHAHERGIYHRDIKPSNILLSAQGQPLLLDFNLAQDQHDSGQATLGGTVAYMAPEHLRALLGRTVTLSLQVDRRSDIYSLGMVLYEMLAGARPFAQSTTYSAPNLQIEAMALERSRAVPSLRTQRSDVPWTLESIVRQCLQPNPARRYQQAGHLAEDLQRFLEDRSLKHAPELSRLEQLQKWMRRHSRLAIAGAVALVAVLLLAIAGAVLARVRGHLAVTQSQPDPGPGPRAEAGL